MRAHGDISAALQVFSARWLVLQDGDVTLWVRSRQTGRDLIITFSSTNRRVLDATFDGKQVRGVLLQQKVMDIIANEFAGFSC